MAVEASIVVEFGEGVSEDETVLIEFDDQHSNNLDAAGDIKSTFSPGEQPVFIVQHADTLRIANVLCTHGSIGLIGNNPIRSREKEILFTTLETEESLGYLNLVQTNLEWFGNTGSLLIENNQAILDGGTIPCLGNLNFDVVFNSQYMLTPPVLNLINDETYKIVVVIYMENAI